MNVLLICTEKLPVPNIRGGAIQTYICGVSSYLSKQHKLTIIGRTDPDLPKDKVENGIRYVRVDPEDSSEVYATKIVRFIRKNPEKFDIIHIFNRPKMVLPIQKESPTSRIILSMHNDMFTPDKLDAEEGNKVIKRTERIITISNYVGKAICDYFPQAKSKLKTIYSGVDLSNFAPSSESRSAKKDRESIRKQYKLDNKKVILYVGRLSRNKGPDVLIRAMSKVKHKDAVLVIVGGAWYNDDSISDYVAYLRALAERSPIPVITTGYVQAKDVHRWFCAGDIFVCTSNWQEPLARVHYEAMAAGLPFITTARGGNPEIIRNNNGLLVNNPDDPAEYAKHINHLLSNMKQAQQMGINGRRLVEEKFTWKRVASDILSVWK